MLNSAEARKLKASKHEMYNDDDHVCKYARKGNMPQTKPKRTLSENFISFDWRFLVAIIGLHAQFEQHQTRFYVARFERT